MFIIFSIVNYQYESPLSMKEPGIGYLIFFCVIQFLVGNIILFLIESNIFSYCKCNKKKSVSDTPTPNEQVCSNLEFLLIKID